MRQSFKLDPLSVTTYVRMTIVIILLFITGSEVNQLGIRLAFNGMLISLVTSGHGLIIGEKFGINKLLSHEILILFIGIFSILIWFEPSEVIPLILFFAGSLVFAHGSLVMKISGDTANLYRLLIINIIIKCLILVIFYREYLIVLALFGISDLIYISVQRPDWKFLSFSLATLVLAAGGFFKSIREFTAKKTIPTKCGFRVDNAAC